MNPEIRICAKKIRECAYVISFTGAGISAESGVPTFRDEDGLWQKFSPELLEIDNFYRNPAQSWEAIYEIFYKDKSKIKPNFAHLALAKFEKLGLLKGVITQNIDNLHFEAGSRNVIEFHGNTRDLICTKCGIVENISILENRKLPPLCTKCGSVLKPDFVFFGEPIPTIAYQKAFEMAEKADLIIVIGTSGVVYPAAMLPQVAKQNRATIIEINPTINTFANNPNDIFIQKTAVEAMRLLCDELGIEVS